MFGSWYVQEFTDVIETLIFKAAGEGFAPHFPILPVQDSFFLLFRFIKPRSNLYRSPDIKVLS